MFTCWTVCLFFPNTALWKPNSKRVTSIVLICLLCCIVFCQGRAIETLWPVGVTYSWRRTKMGVLKFRYHFSQRTQGFLAGKINTQRHAKRQIWLEWTGQADFQRKWTKQVGLLSVWLMPFQWIPTLSGGNELTTLSTSLKGVEYL